MRFPNPLKFLVVLAVLAAVCCKPSVSEETTTVTKVFPPEAVCRYPSASTIVHVKRLGNGSWQQISKDDQGAGFFCGNSNSSVRLFSNDSGSVTIEYNAHGSQRGASDITLTYTSSSNSLPNESTYRNVFSRFGSEMTTQALMEPLPDLATKKIANLKSFASTENTSAETFYIGEGFAILDRHQSPDGSTIKVTLQLFPDKELKLKM